MTRSNKANVIGSTLSRANTRPIILCDTIKLSAPQTNNTDTRHAGSLSTNKCEDETTQQIDLLLNKWLQIH